MEKFEFPFIGKTWRAAYIKDDTEAGRIIRNIKEAYPKDSDAVLGLDIETIPKKGYKGHKYGGLAPSLSEIATVQIYCPNEEEVFLFHINRYAYGIHCLRGFLETRKFIAHNAQFEMAHLLHNGVNLQSLGCSMLLFRLLIHAIYDSPGAIKTTLEQLIWAAFHEVLPKEEQAGDWSQTNLTEAQKIYAVKDAIATQLGGMWCVDRMIEYDVADLIKFYKLNKDAQKAIAQMTLNGIALDVPFHNDLIAQWREQETAAKTELDKTFPPDLNPRSTTQLSKWFTEELSKTPEGQIELAEWPLSDKTGNLVCDAETLEQFSHLEVVAPLQKYRKVSKLLTTYGESLQNCINKETGRIHASFSQCYTDTGRLSSFSPNLQNLPRDKSVRGMFKAQDGYEFVCADLGQIEVRVFAMHSEDYELLTAFEEGVDIYKLTASKLLRKPVEEISKEERQLAKAILLGRLFGLGANTMIKYARTNYKVQLTLKEAKDLIKAIDRGFPQGRNWQKQTTDAAEVNLVSTSRMGKINRLAPDRYYNKSLNHPVQSDAAACIIKAITILDSKIREAELDGDVKIVNCVHDELLVESKKELVEWTKEALYDSMIEGVLHVFPEACERGLVDVKSGPNWAEAKG